MSVFMCIYMYMCLFMRLCLCVWVCICMCAYENVCVVCMCDWVCVFLSMHIYVKFVFVRMTECGYACECVGVCIYDGRTSLHFMLFVICIVLHKLLQLLQLFSVVSGLIESLPHLWLHTISTEKFLPLPMVFLVSKTL